MLLHETLADERHWGEQPFARRPKVSKLQLITNSALNSRSRTVISYNDCARNGPTSDRILKGQRLPKSPKATLLRIVFDQRSFVPGQPHDLFYMPGRVPKLSPEEFDEQAEAMLADTLYAGPSVGTEFFGTNGDVSGRCRLWRQVNYYNQAESTLYRGYLQGTESHRMQAGRFFGKVLHASNEEVVGQTYQISDYTIGQIATAQLLYPKTQ
jgi:hypothetical protein